MYESFYHLKGSPFSLTPDPRFYFPTGGHNRFLAFLRYGIYRSEGFVAVTGDVGAGKTTLVHSLLGELAERQDIVVAHIPMTQWEANDLIGMVAAAYGLSDKGMSKAAVLHDLIRFLTVQAGQGKRAILIIDEAQNLSVEGLEALRLLANHQEDYRALLQGILVGQPTFRKTLIETESLEPLRQRIIASCHLYPMSFDETWRYVEHRLSIVGWANDPEFTLDAHKEIYESTSGVPRRVNTLCERILLAGYVEEVHQVTEQFVNTVIQELHEESFGDGPDNDRSEGCSTNTTRDKDSVSPVGTESLPSQAYVEQRILRLEERLEGVEAGIATSLDDMKSSIKALERRLEAQQAETLQIRQTLNEEVENLLFWFEPGQ